MNKRIIYTRKRDGGVSICCPSARLVRVMSCGGLWAGHPRGFIEAQVERQIAAGIAADVARRYALAVQFGGLTTAEALGLICARDCEPHGVACELWDLEDIPRDRTYRDAWRRSSNGGPIWIDERKATAIDEARAWAAYEATHGAR